MSEVVNKIRRKFTQLPNQIVLDTSLSDGAFRVFCYMSTKPDGWKFNNKDIMENLHIKRPETMAKYWKELINSGWISRSPLLNKTGKPTGYFDYDLNFEPALPSTENTEQGSTENQDYPQYGRTVLPPSTENAEVRKNRTYSNTEINREYITENIFTDINVSDFSSEQLEATKNWIEFRTKTYKLKKSPQAIKVVVNNLRRIKDSHDITKVIAYFIDYTTWQNIDPNTVESALRQIRAEKAANHAN